MGAAACGVTAASAGRSPRSGDSPRDAGDSPRDAARSPERERSRAGEWQAAVALEARGDFFVV